ncbi:uncharacterized protein LOC141719692 [Apium graveolens]|uniref:uncharacterized protein LOC141719692 n=1 Tax=Apium graveolens TaxID=4045 RepID=UPI003D7C0B85
MFPVAYAIVESENTSSWRWFLDLLRDDLDLGNGNGYTIISDQHKGLENAMREFLPEAEHRLCVRHLFANFKKRFGTGLLKRQFWIIATATYPTAHVKAMKGLEKLYRKAHAHLAKFDAKSWTKAYISTLQRQTMLTTTCLSHLIHGYLMRVLNMLQEIHFKLMRRVRLNKERMEASQHQICPVIRRKLDFAVRVSREWQATWDGHRSFMVRKGTRSVTVDLEERTCACRVWDLTGVPCAHVVAAIHDRRQQPMSYVSHYFTRELYLRAYGHSIEALRGEDFWELHNTAEMLPPDMPKKLRGRPKKMRRREEWEDGTQSRSKTQDAAEQQGQPEV